MDALLHAARQIVCNLGVFHGPVAIAAALQQAEQGADLPSVVRNEGAAEVELAQEPLKLLDGARQLHTQQELQSLASNAVFGGGTCTLKPKIVSSSHRKKHLSAPRGKPLAPSCATAQMLSFITPAYS